MVENIGKPRLSAKVDHPAKSPEELKSYEKSLDKRILSFFKKGQAKKEGVNQQSAKLTEGLEQEKGQKVSQIKVELDDIALAEALKKQGPANKGVKSTRSVNLLDKLSSKPDQLVNNISEALLAARELSSSSSMNEVVLACLNFVKQNSDNKGEVKDKDSWKSTNETIKETAEGGISFEGDSEDLAIALKSLCNSTLAKCGYSNRDIETRLNFVGGKTAQGSHISLGFKGDDGKEYSLDVDSNLTSSVNELSTVGDRYTAILFDSTTSKYVNLDNLTDSPELILAEIKSLLSSDNEEIYKVAADEKLYDAPMTQTVLLELLLDVDDVYDDYVQEKVVDRFVDPDDPVLFSLTDINSVINDDSRVGSYVRQEMIPRLTQDENQQIIDDPSYCDDAKSKARDDLASIGGGPFSTEAIGA